MTPSEVGRHRPHIWECGQCQSKRMESRWAEPPRWMTLIATVSCLSAAGLPAGQSSATARSHDNCAELIYNWRNTEKLGVTGRRNEFRPQGPRTVAGPR